MKQVISGSIYGIVFVAMGLGVLFGPFDKSKKKDEKVKLSAREKILGIVFIVCGVLILATVIWYIS